MVYILYIVTWLVGNETSKHLPNTAKMDSLAVRASPKKFEARSERRLIGGIFRGVIWGIMGGERPRNEDSSYPKNPWDVGRGVKLPPVLRPFRGVIRRVWCFNKRGQDY